MSAPQLLLSRKANGVLPVNSAATSAAVTASSPVAKKISNSAGGGSASTRAKKSALEGDKVVVRRLPPGLTEEEFVAILGEEWKPSGGKIGWCSFHPGKVSRDPSKPSRAAFACLHVLRREDLLSFSNTVRGASWADDKDSWTNAVLVGPPVAEFSVYKKIPSGKTRSDNRQGTIDQDPEFMVFLEALANPSSAKDAAAGSAADGDLAGGATGNGAGGDDDSAKAKTKATSTPLIEYLREKKANKGKEAAKSSKSGRHDSQAGKGKTSAADESSGGKKKSGSGRDGKTDRAEKEKSGGRSKGSVKILTKRAIAEAARAANTMANTVSTAAASKSTAGSAAAAASSSSLAASSTPNASTPAANTSTKEEPPKSRRADIAAAARILQRDLGLSPVNAHRRARQQVAAAQGSQDPAEANGTSGGGGGGNNAKSHGRATKERDNKGRDSGSVAADSTSATAAISATTAAHSAKGSVAGERGERGGASSSSRSQRGKKGSANPSGEPTKGRAAATSDKTDFKAPPKILLKKRDDTVAISPASPSASAPASVSIAADGSGPKAVGGGGGGSGGGGQKGKASAPAANKRSASTALVSTSAVTAGATRAFVKHANQSQGVTEPLLREAMDAFGAVTSVEMDRRKGFAFVDFADPASLLRALEASPITVAQAAVQVLERKERESKKNTGAGSGQPGVTAAPGGGAANGIAGSGNLSAGLTPASSKSGPASRATVSSASGATSTGPNAASDKGDGKRGGRRRGGRGRGGGGGPDGQAKECHSGGGSGSKRASEGNAAPSTTDKTTG